MPKHWGLSRKAGSYGVCVICGRVRRHEGKPLIHNGRKSR